MINRSRCLSVLVLLLAAGCAPAANEPASPVTAPSPTFECAVDDGGIALADDLCATVFAADLGRPRHAAVADNGDLYVARQAIRRRNPEGEIVIDAPAGVYALRDTDGDGVADQQEAVNEVGETGIALHDGYLYYASTTEIWRVARATEELVPTGQPERVVWGFPQQGQHASKPMTFDDSGNLYVNVGAPSNACQVDMRTPGSMGEEPCSQLELQAGIWVYAAGDLEQEHGADGRRYGTGIRNAMALDWNHDVSALYALQHGRDSLFDLWGEMFSTEQSAEIPSEEMFRVGDGDDFGWPYCYHDPNTDQKVLAPEYGGDGVALGRCADTAPTLLAFPAHWAPNDLHFYRGAGLPERYRGGAFVAFHGSWNRMPFAQAGYNVVFVPFANGSPSGDYEVVADSFAAEGEIMSPRDAAHRPTGLAEGPDGSLYIIDDAGGQIWRLRAAGN
ncbi:MAG: sorbosone dehydrogenase [Acidobacteria bacterium]|nr:sorbosone dehydrogenase [Acidobacteriota bacterium]